MDTQHMNESIFQCKSCRGEGDANIWGTRASDNQDKQVPKCLNCQVFKSGPLFISSKGIGWTSWKKRWFILTRKSLVFFRSDPNVPSQKGGEVNLTLGGIDLNNSGSVVVRTDKKLLTVLFPDGHDGRTFTLKAETLEDMYEWKTALENALAQAPSAALVMAQTGIFRNDMMESIEASFEQWRDKKPVKSMIIGRPILLALEDIDGSPSFLEKALRFIEEYGIKVEGILRQSADVEEVEHRIQEYEQGKHEFSPDEDAHVICDCIKHVLRELPSSPVPASCCTALLEAFRTDRVTKVNALRAAIDEMLPEPNRHLLQRILKMMRVVASHKSENRMTISAVAACMAPLLLRPLLAGDCELEEGIDMGNDGSMQLLQAAAAANHAQAIVIILLEEYERIFLDGSFTSELYSGSEDCDDDDDDDEEEEEEEESTDEEILEDEGYHDAHNDLDTFPVEDPGNASSRTESKNGSDICGDLYENKALEYHDLGVVTPKFEMDTEATQEHADTTPFTERLDTAPFTEVQHNIDDDLSFSTHNASPRHDALQKSYSSNSENSSFSVPNITDSHEYLEDIPCSATTMLKSASGITPSCAIKLANKSDAPVPKNKRPTVWGRTSARKNLSMEAIEYSSDDETVIQRLESTKNDLQAKIAKEVQGNAMLQANLERRKEALHDRRVALEQDVKRLQEQLWRERDLHSSLEAGLMNMRPGQLSLPSLMDQKMRADLEEIALAEADVINLKQKVTDLRGQLSQQRQQNYNSLCESCGQRQKDQPKYVDIPSSTHLDEDSSRREEAPYYATKETMKTHKQDISVSQTQQTYRKHAPEVETQTNAKSPGASNSSSGDVLSNWGNVYSKKPIRSENAGRGEDNENLSGPIEDPSDSLDKLPLEKQQLSCMDNINGGKPSGPSLDFSTEEITGIGANDASKESIKGENDLFGIDSDDMKTNFQDLSPSHRQTSRQHQPSLVAPNCTNSVGYVSVTNDEQTTPGQIAASKKPSSDKPPSPHHQPSMVVAPHITNSADSVVNSANDKETKLGRHAAPKKASSRLEDTASVSTSSALARLTNRLNFLKERRSQLVSELQKMEPGRSQGPKVPKRANSR